ncbi:MAG: hypothetical protein K1X29_07960 [Bdellovibrionales bacterium]|nr:hypothetical protein [Bdellovibrionales bacterium]
MKRSMLFYICLGFAFSSKVVFAQWGAGISMGMQACPYGMYRGAGSYSVSDELYAAWKEKNDKNNDFRSAKKKLQSATQRRKNYENKLKSRLSGDIVQDVINHICNSSAKTATQSACNNVASGGTKDTPAVSRDSSSHNCTWVEYASDKGGVNDQICENENFVKGNSESHKYECKTGIKYFGDACSKEKDAEVKKGEAEQEYYEAKEKYEMLKDEVKNDRDDDEDTIEGVPCVDCVLAARKRRESSLVSQIGSLALGGAALGGSLYLLNQSMKADSRLGYPVQGYAAPIMNMGLPFLMAGAYGAMGGGGIGAGGFGCAPTIGNYGAYPMGNLGIMGGQLGMNPGMMGGAFGYPSMFRGAPAALGFPYAGMEGRMNPALMGNPLLGNPLALGNPMFGGGGGAPNVLPYMGGALGNGLGGNPFGGGLGTPGILPMMGGLGGLGGVGGFNPNSLAYQADMMNQALQMQAQQAQAQMASLNDYLRRAETVNSLQNEIVRMQQQIMQISSGGYYSGSYSGAPNVLPYMGSSNSATSSSPFSNNNYSLLPGGTSLLPGSSTTVPGSSTTTPSVLPYIRGR